MQIRSKLFVVCCCLMILGLSSASASRGNTIVRFDTSQGSFDAELFDDVTPITVANFLQYIAAQRYDDTVVHRSDQRLGIIQGGIAHADLSPIETYPLIPLEYNLPNERGTLAMARYFDASDPLNTTTASSSWFFNTVDNSAILGPPNHGGYAVFGRVLGDGMEVVDAIQELPVFNFGPAFPYLGQLPLDDYTQVDYANGVDYLPHMVVVHSISVVPEPATAGMALMAALMLAFCRARARVRL